MATNINNDTTVYNMIRKRNGNENGDISESTSISDIYCLSRVSYMVTIVRYNNIHINAEKNVYY